MQKRILFLNSGGLDSLCVAKITREQYPDAYIKSLFFDFGTPNANRATVASKLISEKYCDDWEKLYFKKETPEGQVDAASLFWTDCKYLGTQVTAFPHLPFQNLYFYFMAFAYAVCNDFEYVLTGIKHDSIRKREFFIYFHKFIRSVSTFAMLELLPKLETPLMGEPKELIYHICKDDDLLEYTVSCNLEEECGHCSKCTSRAEFGIIQK